MPPRTRPTPAPDTFHAAFDPGVTGRRTGIMPPKVKPMPNGVEPFSDYFASPRKDPSVSPPNHTPVRNTNPTRPRNERPDMFHEIGERGRKTGIRAPKDVERDAGGCEKFDAYLRLAAQETNKGIIQRGIRSAQKSNSHKRKQSTATFVDDGDDDDQDMDLMDESMSLDTPQELEAIRDRGGNSSHQLSNQNRRFSQRPQKRRSGSTASADRSTRTLNDSELVDFETVPEGPSRGRSRLRSLDGDDQPMNVGDADDDDDSDGDAQDVGEPTPINRNDIGMIDDFDNPAEFPNALEDITEEDEDQDMEAAQTGGSGQATRPRPAKRRKSNPRASPLVGTRRSARARVPTLRHWKNERVIYGRSMTPDGTQRVLGMVDVVRFPREEVLPLAMRRRGRNASAKVKKSESQQPLDGRAPEDGWDSETRPNGIVYSYTKHKDCERTIVQTKRMVTIDVEDRAGVPDSFQFQRVCKDADFVAAGLMFIPVGGGKPLKPAKDNFYVFTVLEGAVSVNIHRTTFVVAPQGMFWVPRGNAYSIQNISQRTAKLTFAQARRAIGEEPVAGSDDDEERSHESTPSTSKGNKNGKQKATQKDADNEQDGGDQEEEQSS